LPLLHIPIAVGLHLDDALFSMQPYLDYRIPLSLKEEHLLTENMISMNVLSETSCETVMYI
jgi:hypothetical protein